MFSSTMNKESIAYTKPRRSKQIAKGGYREMIEDEEYLEEDEFTDYSQAHAASVQCPNHFHTLSKPTHTRNIQCRV